jgi:prepilin-type N-terminal cleavage/methylation domain-containing protein
MTSRPRRGFTLIELMIVVAIIGVLAAIALPKFGELLRKSTEAASKGNLASVRSALTVYYGDMEGQYPAQLASLTVSGKYLSQIGAAKTPNYHFDSSAETDALLTAANDAGGWLYDNVAGDANLGNMLIDCTHTDTKGAVWTTY